jgi:uncharacterized protein involved in copper resistance
MSGWVIVVVVVAIVVLLAVGGAISARRRMEASSAGFTDHLDRANVELATAHAADRGWDPEALERAAGAALRERHPEVGEVQLTLVEVVDRPGIEEDVARYRAQAPDGSEVLLTMVRRSGSWVAETIES